MRSLLFVVVVAVCGAGCGTKEKDYGEGDGGLYPLEEGAWWRDRVIEVGAIECPDKIVSIGAPGDIVLHPNFAIRSGVTAFPALSEDEDKYGYRWQEVTEDGSVRRHLDEWFDLDGVHTEIVHYCPFKTRVDDGAHACVGAAWTETWKELTITVDGAANPDDCANPEKIAVNPADCTWTGEVEGCVVEVVDFSRDWEVRAVDELVTIDSKTYTTLHVWSDNILEGITERWWARGVGKIKEKNIPKDENEELVDYCLPTPTDDCQASKPSDDELQSECEE